VIALLAILLPTRAQPRHVVVQVNGRAPKSRSRREEPAWRPRVDTVSSPWNWTMHLHYPKSFARLVLAGFACAVLPPMVALVTNALSVDRLVKQGEHAVRMGVDLTQHTRVLEELVGSMERTVRQMIVLEDAALARNYESLRSKFLRELDHFASLPLYEEHRAQLGVIATHEAKIHGYVSEDARTATNIRVIADEFALLAEQAWALSESISSHINAEILTLHRSAERTQQLIVWQMLAVIPLVILLVGGSMRLLARPVGELDHAIRQLGDGELQAGVEVRGPADLVRLGQRLDWLRLRLLEVEAQKSRFLQHVSHELKTPLAAIWDGAALLVEEVAGQLNAKQREIARILQHSSVQLRRLIEDLLDFTAAESLSNSADVKQVRLGEIVGKAAAAHTLAATAKGLALRIESAEVAVPGDEEKLRVVVDNLLSNAIKYSPAGGRIDIRIKRAGDTAVIDVVDSGPGIPEQEGHRVFDAFYQGQPAASAAIRGSGLGLSIAREHVLAHKGRIEIVQFAPKGAHMRIVLPMQAEAEAT
jgi:two-component system, NtrC family, sensor histidine kinase GlrK